jgi:hypothetical protein
LVQGQEEYGLRIFEDLDVDERIILKWILNKQRAIL